MATFDSTTKQYNTGEGKSARINGVIGYVDITVAAESSNGIAVTFQARRLNAHDNMDRPFIATIYQYEDTAGTIDSEIIGGTGAVMHTMAVTTGTLQSALSDGLEIAVRSNDTGAIIITLTDDSAASTSTKYLGFSVGGFFCQSGAITFA